jgi:uridylate kinase
MKRVLLKLSGEALARESGKLYDHAFVNEVAATIASLVDEGYQIALVTGAGNIWRGREGVEMDRIAADRMGMLATVINAIYLKDAIVRAGKSAAVMTAVPMAPFAENYSPEAAVKHLEDGEVVVFGAGLGIPFLSTDTTGAVRAAEIGVDEILMAKNVDYIYTADPRKVENPPKLEKVKATEVLAMNLKAIDATATAFSLSSGIPVRVFGFKEATDIAKAVRGEKDGTVILAE